MLSQRNKKSLKLFVGVGVVLLTLSISSIAHAQNVAAMSVSKPLVLLGLLASLALVPFMVMMVTSFVKIAVVLSLVRNAIGTQQVPPNIVVTGLAVILTIYIMAPVGQEIYSSAKGVINQGSNQPMMSQATVKLLLEGVEKGKGPVRAFLLKHSHEKEQNLFYNLGLKLENDPKKKDEIKKEDFINLIPAFVVSELAEAFQIGFIIFLPFLVIDLVIANILLALGMFQISPITISLPFKLLLFVLVDGWHLIARGLILGYV
ncbi:MAG: type III secretion system export apparatus subunit SctR [Pseudomonadota bacterium]